MTDVIVDIFVHEVLVVPIIIIIIINLLQCLMYLAYCATWGIPLGVFSIPNPQAYPCPWHNAISHISLFSTCQSNSHYPTIKKLQS